LLNNFNLIFSNNTLWTAIAAWFVAQFIKIIIEFSRTRKFEWSLLFSSGGMPSAHTAFVMSMTVMIGIGQGFDSAIFAVSAITTLVVMYDAAGVRRAAGQQAQVLNKLIATLEDPDVLFDTKLKELLGHSPAQVFAGAVLWIIMGVVCS